MPQNVRSILLLCSFLFCFTLVSPSVEAATFKGTLESVNYTETELEDGTMEKKPTTITLINSSGNKTTLNIDEYTVLYINNTLTKIEGFKKGMEVEATVNLRKVKTLRGTSDIVQGAITEKSKQKTGIVTKLDPYGMFITVKLDGGAEENFFLNKNTAVVKSASTVDISHLFEGDRVKLKFSSYDTSVLAEVEMIATGIQIERLYRGTIQSVNTSANKITVSNGHPFENWYFGLRVTKDLSTYSFEHTTPIYVGTEKITKNDLRNYQNSEVYFVTVKEFGKEVIQKIVVAKSNERSYYEPMTAVNTSLKFMQLETKGKVYFHDGTIIVRNGRLVEPTTLTAYGTAHVITNGVTTDQYANVVHIVNDGFTSPNFTTHDLYYAQINNVNGYTIGLNNAIKLDNWSPVGTLEFAFSNSTNTEKNYEKSVLRVLPETELEIEHIGDYGYFYVKDGHVQAIHILHNESGTNLHFKGIIESIDLQAEKIDVINVSQMYSRDGTWFDSGYLDNVEINKALIIKDGKIIEPIDLKPSDRVVLYTRGLLNCHVLIVN